MECNPERAYIYCTPFLDEIDRIKKSCTAHRFAEPQNYVQTKLDDFNDLLEQQRDIAVTHSTFLNSTQDTIDLIRRGGYTIIIDEALDVLSEFNKIGLVENDSEQTIKHGDIQKLLDGKFIEIDSRLGAVKWVGKHYDDGKYTILERLARLNRVYLVRGKMMVCVFPPEMFRASQQVFVMTYMLGGSPIKPYFDLFRLEYEMKTVCQQSGEYALREYTADSDTWFRNQFRELVSICSSDSLNAYDRYSLSKSWYARNTKKDGSEKLKAHMGYFFRKVAKAKASNIVGEVKDGVDLRQTEIMWTCFKDYQRDISGQGYTTARHLTKEEKKLPEAIQEEIESRLSCFVSCNAKATNKYCYRWALAYCCNLYYSEMLSGFFTDNGIEFDNDKFALSNLIQWICRSRVRNGEPVVLYLPSSRMRSLYQKWLDGVM